MQLKDVWASSDGGRNWIQVCQAAQWEGRQGHAAVVVHDNVYLMGGFGGATRFNDLWKSSDCGKSPHEPEFFIMAWCIY
jgi:Galactose oxidase, central domain